MFTKKRSKNKKDERLTKFGRTVTYVIFLAVIFLMVVAGVLIYRMKFKKKQTGYEYVSGVTLPVVYTTYSNRRMNTLHGYTEEMNGVTMRDSIMVIGENRILNIVVNPYDNRIKGADYEIRSMNGERLLENDTVSNFNSDAQGNLNAQISVTNLIEPEEEYSFMLSLDLNDGKKARYYMRIIMIPKDNTSALLEFTDTFSESTYDKGKAEKVIVPYIQPNGSDQNLDFSYADLHSTFNTLTWGDMQIERVSGPDITFYEMTGTQASFVYSSVAKAPDESGVTRSYRIKEFFCVRLREGYVYLLDYTRTMNQIFETEGNSFQEGSVRIGIHSDEKLDVITDDTKTYTAFAYDNNLWCYNAKTDSLSLIFTFADKSDTDGIRTEYDAHTIEPMVVDKDGNLFFLVYGYMNSGYREGMTGVCVYKYTKEEDCIEEIYYFPSLQSYEILKKDIGTMAYVSDENICYLLFGNSIYSIDLAGKDNAVISENVYEGHYVLSDDKSAIVWEENMQDMLAKNLRYLNMKSGLFWEIDGEEGDYVRAVGFIGKDFVYTTGKRNQAEFEAGDVVLAPSYRLRIVDETMNVECNYEQDGIYITDAYIDENRVIMDRAVLENGIFNPIDSDALVLNSDTEKSSAYVRESDTTLLRRIKFIGISSKPGNNVIFDTVMPPLLSNSESMTIPLEGHNIENREFLVYKEGHLELITKNLSRAVAAASSGMGVVLDRHMSYYWRGDTKAVSKEIPIDMSNISGDNSMHMCLNILSLLKGDVLEDLKGKINSGDSPYDILSEKFDERALYLYGVEASDLMYYINRDCPVLVVKGTDEAMLITGYNANVNYKVFHPETGETETIPWSEGEKYFMRYKNRFVSLL